MALKQQQRGEKIMKICRYCDSNSIGYVKDSYDGDFGVCRDCAHINSTVFLWNGDTWFKTFEWYQKHQKQA
jgi:hypothetical protein